jgi:excisionase family DNA binding protein
MNAATEVASLLSRLAELISTPISAQEPESRAMPERVLLKVEEAAERLGIGRTKAFALVRSGQLPSVQIGTLRRVHIDSIREFAARLVAEQRAA